MKYVIDTNILLRVLIKSHPQMYRESVQFLEKVKSNQVDAVLPGVVISELVWTLGSFYKFPKKKVVEAVSAVQNLAGIKIIDDYDYRFALQQYSKHGAKYVDCLIASIDFLQSKKWLLVSYDKDFDKLGVKRVEPNRV